MTPTPSMQRFTAHFGELGPRWGIEADTCRAHALLYLAGKPTPLPEIAAALALTKAQARATLADLAQWGMARPVADDCWDASGEPWDLLVAALEARRRRELQPALDMLRACRDEAAGDGTPAGMRGRIARVLGLVEDIAAIDVQARRLPSKAIVRLVGLGGRAARLLSRAFPLSA